MLHLLIHSTDLHSIVASDHAIADIQVARIVQAKDICRTASARQDIVCARNPAATSLITPAVDLGLCVEEHWSTTGISVKIGYLRIGLVQKSAGCVEDEQAGAFACAKLDVSAVGRIALQ